MQTIAPAGARGRKVGKALRRVNPLAVVIALLCLLRSGSAEGDAPEGAEIRATVRNTSARDGGEVVQLYVGGGQPLAGTPHVRGRL